MTKWIPVVDKINPHTCIVCGEKAQEYFYRSIREHADTSWYMCKECLEPIEEYFVEYD